MSSRQEKKQQMVEDLKNHGFNSKQVSVSARKATYSSSFNVTVRDPNVSVKEIENIVTKYDKYQRDASGDILAGGNDYVFVNRPDGFAFPAEVFDPRYAAVMDTVKLVRGMEDRTGKQIAGHYFIMNDDWAIRLSTDYEDGIHMNIQRSRKESDETIAREFADAIIEAELERAYINRGKKETT